jgi:L-ascorbate metabolism protein UlaG (beta-lactamase superfamily)
MKFQQIRSATAIITYGDSRFLVDPWLAPKDTFPPIPGSKNPYLRCPIHELPLPLSEILAVDAVIATHLHFDHFDDFAMKAIPKDMPIFAQDEIDAATLQKNGFGDVRILRYGGSVFNGVTLYKTDCIHGQPGEIGLMYEKLELPFRKEACGVVMRHPNEAKTLYLVGDSVWCDYVSSAIRSYAPSVIIINAARAAIEGFGPIIMGLEDIEQILAAAPNATIIASHMDNVGHATLWRKDIKAYVEKNSLAPRILIPEDGEVCSFR